MGSKKRGKGGIPDGWLGCPPMSTGFIDDRFFVFKTPLKPELNGKVASEHRFSMDTIFQQLSGMNNSRIGLWIDLTNTTRYYNPKDVINRGIWYEKFACEGHGKPPSRKAIYDFCGLVHQFFRTNSQDYIGVHCTHGFNRTGFLICCYLIRFRRYSAEEAVLEFQRHRNPGIYRQSYVDELYLMTHPIKRPLQVLEPEWLQNPAKEQPRSSNSAEFQSATGGNSSRSISGVANAGSPFQASTGVPVLIGSTFQMSSTEGERRHLLCWTG